MLKIDRMSNVDYAWRRMDCPNNLMVINAALMFDGELDIQHLRRTLGERLQKYPRFRQLAVVKGNQPYWQDAADFDLNEHVVHVPLQQNWGRAELQQYMSAQTSRPLADNKPLWQMHVLENADASFAIVLRLHHCIADGIALMDVIHTLTDADAGQNAHSLSKYAVRQVSSSASSIGNKVLHAAKLALETGKLGTLISDGKTAFKGTPEIEKQAVWSSQMSLDDVRAVARRHDATVNDVLCSAIAGAMREYLGEQGQSKPASMVRAALTFNLRNKAEAHKLGNEFGLVALNLQTGIADPIERLLNVKRRMQKLKNSPQAQVTQAILGMASRLPLAMQRFALNMFTNKGSLVISNLEGPQQVRWLAGARMKDLVFWVPQSGNLGFGVSIISYAGRVQFGVFADRKLMPNPDRLAELCAEQFAKLAQASKARRAQQAAPGYVPMPDTIAVI